VPETETETEREAKAEVELTTEIAPLVAITMVVEIRRTSFISMM
jgi:hypothetical protein